MLSDQASMIAPWSAANMREIAISSVATGEIDTLSAADTRGSGVFFSMVATVAFNVTFRDGSGAAATPSENFYIPAGMIISFALLPSNTKMNVLAEDVGSLLVWRSSR